MFESGLRRWTVGLFLLGVVIVLWVLSSFLINYIFEDGTYRKPFFITYINTASFIFYLIPTFKNIVYNYKITGKPYIHEELLIEEEANETVTNYTADNEQCRRANSIDEASNPLLEAQNIVRDAQLDRLSLPETIRLSAEFCVLWFAANFVTNASLGYTSVASQTILSSTSSFFTLFIGAAFRVETIDRVKVIGSLISFIGILLVTKSDVHIPQNTHMPHTHALDEKKRDKTFEIFFGNMLALSGALFYGLYSTLLKRKVKDESRINMKIFFGFVGLFTLILLWPTLLLLDKFNWETFVIPRDPLVITIILVNCLITFVSDFCWASAMLLTSPLTVTLGLSITIPLAMFGDFLFRHKTVPFLYFCGAILILGSFFVINKNSEKNERNEEAIA